MIDEQANSNAQEMGSEPWKPVFLTELRARYSVTHACKAARVGRTTAYEHRDSDKAFAAAWAELWETNIDDLEDSTLSRAIHGWDEPVFYQGVECGSVRRFDNTLASFMLRKLRKARYGDDQAALDEADKIAAKIRQAVAEARSLYDADKDPE